MSDALPRRLVTIAEFGAMTSLATRTVTRLIKRGMPVYHTTPPGPDGRHGRGARLDPEESLAWIKAGGHAPPPVRRGRPRLRR
jgi:hypothetical protein